MSRMGFVIITIAGGALLAAGTMATAADIPLRRSPRAYHILARKDFKGKNYTLSSPGCNIGVNNCLAKVKGRGVFLADETQLVGDNCKSLGGEADVFQLFCNQVKKKSATELARTTVRHPGPPSDPNFPAESWDCPILADESDATFIDACNTLGGASYPAGPFTVGATHVNVKKGGSDCEPLAVDSNPGNDVCDLPPGDYGDIAVRNGAIISFDGGVYNARRYKNGHDVTMEVKGPTTLNVSSKSKVVLGNRARLITECGDFRLNYEGTKGVSFGKRGRLTLDVCSPHGKLRLGNTNILKGHFFADAISSDRNNTGFCCGGCSCFDLVDPNPAAEGIDVTLSGGCQLNNVDVVRICGQPATIQLRSSSGVVVTVPVVGAPQSCPVEVESVTGTFLNETPLDVIP